jgi:uncharacterized membrane protein
MALIEINIPEEEGWEDDLAGRILLAVTGLLAFRLGFRLWTVTNPESPFSAYTAILCYAIGVQLLIVAASDIDLERWGRRITYLTLGGLTLALVASILRTGWLEPLSTDAMMFSRYSVDLLLQGQNPYTESMAPAFNLPGVRAQFATPRVDGSKVETLSYPAGAVLWFVPQRILVGNSPLGLRATILMTAVLVPAIIAHDLRPQLAPAALVASLAGRNLLLTAAGGVFHGLWVLPTLLGLRDWFRGNRLRAAAWLGLAASVKQLPWVLAPFFAIWIWHEADSPSTFVRDAVGPAAVAIGVFAAINAPFIVAAPEAWLEGVLTPLSPGAPLVHQGMGLALLAFVGIAHLPTEWFVMAAGLGFGIILLAYHLYHRELRWALAALPLIVWMLHTRSLASYFTGFGPLIVWSVAAHWDALPGLVSASAGTERRDAHAVQA